MEFYEQYRIIKSISDTVKIYRDNNENKDYCFKIHYEYNEFETRKLNAEINLIGKNHLNINVPIKCYKLYSKFYKIYIFPIKYELLSYNLKEIYVKDINPIKMIFGIINGLNFLHNNKIIHGDLKLDNIMLDNNYIPKIIDFDSSINFETTTSKDKKEKRQTFGYFSNTTILNTELTYSDDIFQVGIIFYQLLFKDRYIKIINKSYIDNYTITISKLINQYAILKSDNIDNIFKENYIHSDDLKNMIFRNISEINENINTLDNSSKNLLLDMLQVQEKYISLEDILKYDVFKKYVN